MSLELRGLDRLLGTIDRTLGRLGKESGAPRALYNVGELWMTVSKTRTPVRFGVLKGSGHVTQPEQVGTSWQVRLVFGGPAAPYAKIVHENLKAHHAVGQAKYLESVVSERKSGLAREVAALMRT